MYKPLLFLSVAICLTASISTQADDLNFDYRINTQLFVSDQDLEDKSLINAGNRFEIHERLYELDFRPDFSLSNDKLSLSIKPRAELTRDKTKQPAGNTKTSRESDTFMQEWLARVKLNDELFASYGRENLQWGPAMFLSASNPFFSVNGRNVPQREVGGMDYARLVWVANDAWTGSLIVNTDDGRQSITDSSTSYAIKLDYTGQDHYFSIIPSYREGRNNADDVAALGFFGLSNVSDALLVYLEGSLAEHDASQGLAGVSYTFEEGTNLVLEYFHQEDGCSRDLIHACLAPGTTPTNLERTRLLREDYLFLQAARDWDQRRTNLVARLAYNLNDDSTSFILHLNRAIGDYWNTFAVATVTGGDENTEFGSLIKSSLVAGLEFTL
jgi:hypothetical protein